MSTSVEKALQIIIQLSKEPVTGSELARRLGVHRSTSSRLLTILEGHDFVSRDLHGQLHLGSFFASLPLMDLRRTEIITTARDQLTALGEATGHTIHLAGLETTRIAYWDKIESRQTIRMYSTVGATATPYATGVGKAILAHLDQRRRRALLGGGDFEPYTPHTHRSLSSLETDLEEIVNRGWSLDDEEHEEHIHCVAAPVFDATGNVVAAVSITTPQVLVSNQELQAMTPQLLETAQCISNEMGEMS